MVSILTGEETTMIESPSAATLDTSWEEAAPGPVSPMDSGQEDNLHVSVSEVSGVTGLVSALTNSIL